MSDIENNKEKFLTELTELSKKHGIVIHGCGCCGSPWLDELKENETNKKYVVNSYYSLEWE